MASLKASLPKELETPRLVLELWNRSEQHYTAVIGAFNSPSAGESSIKTPAAVDELFSSIAFSGDAVCPGKTADTSLVCIPRLKTTGDLIGCIIICQEPHYVDVPTAGWLLQEPFMGNGYAPEAAKEFLRFATEDLGISRIIATPRDNNPRSHRVAEKAGMLRGPEFTTNEGLGRVMFHLPHVQVTDELMATITGRPKAAE